MPIYKIRGIDVDFPFEAYDCQIVYMDKVIQSLQEGCNALLESPTGTGKTLCLLCATLAWRKTLGDFSTSGKKEKARYSSSQQPSSQSMDQPRRDHPIIIYASRTHSQLKQVVRELRASNYRPKMVVLGSREQMCIHDEVRLLRGRAQNNACRYLCKKRLCQHHSRVSEYMQSHPELGNKPIDIEDLVSIGRSKGPCPYYLSRELHKAVDILFAPYNYLIDPGNRRSLTGINWNDAILIFDEAHNLESICADAASFDLPSGSLTACISEADQCAKLSSAKMAIEKSTDKQFDPENYSLLGALLKKLKDELDEVSIGSRELGCTRPGHYIYEFLSKLNITFDTANMLIDTIENAALLLEDGSTPENRISAKTKGTVCRLESLKDILQIIFRDGSKDHAKFYRFHVQESQSNTMDSLQGMVSRKPRILSWWCFNPGLAMEEFRKLGVRSIILTSGTLSPLDSFALELNLEFPVRLENPHVISSNQVWVGVVPRGPSGCSFNSSFRTRDSIEYKQELGNAIVNFARMVPDGLLVFFPSYYLMEQCIGCWKNMSHASSTGLSTIWERICKNKKPVIEPKQAALFPQAIEDYEAKLRDNATSGAIFFAVCRGKVSEGLDFADQSGRAVVIVGMPFSMKTDPKIRLKREYLDQQAISRQKDSKVLTGEDWYVQQAARAVNQAVGRVIRHRHDYGAIIFCDERFAQQSYQCQMSYWLRPYAKCYPNFGDVVFTLTRFFRDNANCAQLKPKIEERVEKDRAGKPEDEIISLESDACLNSTAEHFPGKPSLSFHSDTRSRALIQLGQIVPANRSTLSKKQKYNVKPHDTRDHNYLRGKLQTNGGIRINHHHQDDEVVDLTSDDPCFEQLENIKVMTPCSIKKLKLFEGSGHLANCKTCDSLEHECNVDLQHLPRKFCASSSSKMSCKQHPQLALNRLAEAGSSDKSVTLYMNTDPASASTHGLHVEKAASEQQPRNKKTDGRHSNSLSVDEGKTKGSDFLMQVQEKLSIAEYKEFVGLMKAMKSKTMKATSVLESIARLFSAPERFSLLKRFRDFVPAIYRPIYEQHLIANGGADVTA